MPAINTRGGIIMEITKVNKDEIISVGRDALGKVRNNELDVLDNITITLALIIGAVVGMLMLAVLKKPIKE